MLNIRRTQLKFNEDRRLGKFDTHRIDWKQGGQRKAMRELPDGLEGMDDGAVFERCGKKAKVIKSYKFQKIVEKINRQHPKETRHTREEFFFSLLCLLYSPFLSYYKKYEEIFKKDPQCLPDEQKGTFTFNEIVSIRAGKI